MSNFSKIAAVTALSLMPVFTNVAHAEKAPWWEQKKEQRPTVSSEVIPGSSRIQGNNLHNLEIYTSDSLQRRKIGTALDGQYQLVYFGVPYELYLSPEDRPPQLDMSQAGKNGKTVKSLLRDFEQKTREYEARIKTQGGEFNNNSCAIDLALLKETMRILEEKCGASIASKITPVFIFPDYDPQQHSRPVNIEAYVKPDDSKIMGLTGSEDDVLHVASLYKARFLRKIEGKPFSNHTRYTYLMSPDGQNLAKFPPNTLLDTMARQIILEMQSDRNMGLPNTPECKP